MAESTEETSHKLNEKWILQEAQKKKTFFKVKMTDQYDNPEGIVSEHRQANNWKKGPNSSVCQFHIPNIFFQPLQTI